MMEESALLLLLLPFKEPLSDAITWSRLPPSGLPRRAAAADYHAAAAAVDYSGAAADYSAVAADYSAVAAYTIAQYSSRL